MKAVEAARRLGAPLVLCRECGRPIRRKRRERAYYIAQFSIEDRPAKGTKPWQTSVWGYRSFCSPRCARGCALRDDSLAATPLRPWEQLVLRIKLITHPYGLPVEILTSSEVVLQAAQDAE